MRSAIYSYLYSGKPRSIVCFYREYERVNTRVSGSRIGRRASRSSTVGGEATDPPARLGSLLAQPGAGGVSALRPAPIRAPAAAALAAATPAAAAHALLDTEARSGRSNL